MTRKTFRPLVGKFNESGSVATSRRKIKPRPRRCNEVIDVVRADVADSLGASYRRRSQQFDFSPCMFSHTKCKWLNNLLLSVDKPRLIQYATNMQNIFAGETDCWRPTRFV
ncbi:hypothetical protein QE152_g30181 [Popillia japonica]|uniref:Uncharacterized protein n=1 Tax=Popillia japonica TaxID=7064 RepID=A0AAW1JES6_POPJA